MFERLEQQNYMPGGFTVEARRILLEYLLYVQQEIGEQLIAEEEIQAILDAWYDTDGIVVSREELEPICYGSLGSLVFLPDCTVNVKETTTNLPVFYVDVDIRLPKQDVFRWIRSRQRETGKSYFFFSSNYADDKTNLTWNTLRFVVCELGVNKQKDAERVIHAWLGSYQKEYFTEESLERMTAAVLMRALRKEPLFPKNIRPGVAKCLSFELTKRIKREAICSRDELTQETASFYSYVLKQLATYIQEEIQDITAIA